MKKRSKLERDYEESYGEIPRSQEERIHQFLLSHKTGWKENPYLRIEEIRKIPWKDYYFTIYLLPKATPRPRLAGMGHFFYVEGASEHKSFFREALKNYPDLEVITTPCTIHCVSYLPIPKSMSKQEQLIAELGYIRPTSKPDFDNLVKTYTDALQDILISDDALIVSGTSEKYYSWKPRIEIHIAYMESFDSKFNELKSKRKEKRDE